MKIISNEIRPIGFLKIEMRENEVQAIIGAFEELCYIKRIPFEEMPGTRGDIYKSLTEALDSGKKNL